MKLMECLQKHLKEWGSALLPWVTIVSIFVGGWWAYHNFSITDTAEWNPEIRVSTEVLPYDSDDSKTCLLVVHVKPKNIGKVPIELHGGSKGGDISVSVSFMPPKHGTGKINENELTRVEEIKSFVKELGGDYILEPGVEYDDLKYFIVQKGRLYVVNAELDLPHEGEIRMMETKWMSLQWWRFKSLFAILHLISQRSMSLAKTSGAMRFAY